MCMASIKIMPFHEVITSFGLHSDSHTKYLAMASWIPGIVVLHIIIEEPVN